MAIGVGLWFLTVLIHRADGASPRASTSEPDH